ncbi:MULTISPECIES: hypothetical protein [unclassified Variovorax]|uniref:hypothetical protein n=1 Tax=unclassified Variovorax TaxID=663243 RepID=UPI0008386704|nr:MULTISPECIES: hypothetical protein [unclassified Variovorax]VTU42549.1 hypothetical protein SRS16P1_00297 [Variovorax sp. SRS16]VTU42572.1 hypothetical protein E5P1_00295 [Variovorax sp. PBL-E5]PNG50260.1 hypothetical protein CHC06_05883 [Variovorax sp. B2]PNG51133.1 hypothetical protein CHC07_05789 [Variovorax sp. B4]VTU43949.1 hypothetical protein H6P1_00634 [Variovorax sp. PBL-H6]
MYQLNQIKHETANFWVLDVGRKGFEVYQTGLTHSTRVASIGRATEQCPNLGLPRAIRECERRERELPPAIDQAEPSRPPGQVRDAAARGAVGAAMAAQ